MSEFAMPETLDGLTVAELQALIDSGLDALRALGITEDTTDDALLAQGDALMVDLDTISAVLSVATEAATAEAGRADRARAIAARTSAPAAPAAPAPQPTVTETSAEAPAPVPVAPAEAPAEAPIEQGELVTAGGNSPARRAAANAAPPIAPRVRAGTTVLTAAADVPGIATGAILDGLDAVTAAVISRMRGLPDGPVSSEPVRHRYGAAQVRFDGYGELSQRNTQDDYGLVWAAGNESRLEGGSLVAAGGWCAPSETLYDLCQYETVDGLVSVPEFNVTRGGIRWTEGPSFDDIYANCGFQLTEAQVIANTAKTCCTVDCPPFEEIRMDAIGLCVKAPLLTQSQYPELTRRFMEGALVAHAHKVNKYVIDTIASAAGGGTTLTDGGSVMASLTYVDLLAVYMRDQYRMSQTQTIEVIAPFWFKFFMRADMGLAPYGDDAVSDAEVNAWFTARNMSPQWVYDWQSLAGNFCTPTVPTTVDLLMYPAGTWVRGNADVINIDAVYDSAGLVQNVYTALFMEQGILAVQKCTHTCSVTVPLCISGKRGALDLECLTAPSVDLTPLSTSATAGIPGSWSPSSSLPPANVAGLVAQSPAVTASPTTAWTKGQYVQTQAEGTAGRAYWNGTAWTAGSAP